jgi:hypothetical protein
MTSDSPNTSSAPQFTPGPLHEERRRILEWMDSRRPKGGACPVLLSDMRRELGDEFSDEAFEALRRDGVICADFPEAKSGDSGRQFWNFAHWTTIP